MNDKRKKQLLATGRVLRKSKVDLPYSLKMKMAELILNLMCRRENFGLLVILGWKNKWRKFTDMPDVSQDIFNQHHINIKKIKPKRYRRRNINTTANFDGAILIDGFGNILHSGMVIEGLRHKAVADKLNPRHFPDLSAQFGFKQKVHSRHLTAITASYVFKDTTIFTVSEETGAFHVFENGKIIYSTVPKETASTK